MDWRTPDKIFQDMLAKGGWASLAPSMSQKLSERFQVRSRVLQAVTLVPRPDGSRVRSCTWEEDIPRNANVDTLQRLLDSLATKVADKIDQEVIGELLARKLDLMTREEVLEWLRPKHGCLSLMRRATWLWLKGKEDLMQEEVVVKAPTPFTPNSLVISGHVPGGMLALVEPTDSYLYRSVQLEVSDNFFSPKLLVRLDWHFRPSQDSKAVVLTNLREPMTPL